MYSRIKITHCDEVVLLSDENLVSPVEKTVAVLKLLIITHDFNQQMEFAKLSWNYRPQKKRTFEPL